MGLRRLEREIARGRRILLLLVLVAPSLLAAGCSSQPSCSAGLQPYKDKCLTNMAIVYVGCTEGRGISPTTEISAGVGGTLKVVADASLTLAFKRSEQENTPVALQIVKDCMEIARTTSPPNDSEQATATAVQNQLDQAVKDWRAQQVGDTPAISISSNTARKGEPLTVTGSQFWANETVEIRVQATLVAQVKADAYGAFSTTITIPNSAPPPDFDTSITATGRTSAKSADAPFHTAP
jgi:hypothetical protein